MTIGHRMDFSYFRDFTAWLLLALGISANPDAFAGGIFLAFAGGYLASIWMPDADKREVRLMIITSILLGVFIAIIHPKLLGDWPLQFCMGIGGFFSRYVVAILLRMTGRVVSQSENIADAAIKQVTKKDAPK